MSPSRRSGGLAVSLLNDLIAINETEVVRLKEFIRLMEAGMIEMRGLERGTWVLQNARWISEDRATVERLEALMTKLRDLRQLGSVPS